MAGIDDVDGSPTLKQDVLRRVTMGNVTTIGLDIAQNVFQVLL
jgi:hypothetical protein